MKSKLLFILLVVSLLCTIKAAQGELWIKVLTPSGALDGGITIEVHTSQSFIGDCESDSVPHDNYANAYLWMVGETPSNPDLPYVFGPLNYFTTYYIVISGKYAKIQIH